ncbi:hypothetical protein BJ138DRAFT_1153058 [Hygrophoropsis aurantiaca]|uniref:Uncharacterized protein n=1 Tax=Hygrophoropsis aurantiaca TaxID=72124 RepID=A0ACB8AB77_9AGAM|nr:hypothetical protein BJ138DRAFT_1153058 [Hygrophoropsis aurantiaca]
MSSPRTVTNVVETAINEQFATAPGRISPSGDVSESSSPPHTSISSHTQTSNTTPPSTPPRGRSASRYPVSLGPGRVPLHRRGTSKTYERLEDLLREAGYKETRVFTPEGERDSEHNDRNLRARASGSMRGGVGAVVGFLAGLVSRNSSLAREAMSGDEGSRPSMSNDVPVWSPPPSPLTQLQRAKYMNASSSASLSGHSYSTSTESLHKSPRQPTEGTANMRARLHHHHVVQVQHSSRGLPHPSPPHLRQYPRHQSSNFVAPDPPGSARAYLRHMASAPNIQPLSKRPSTSDVSLRSHQPHRHSAKSSRRTVILNAEDLQESDDYRDFRGYAVAEPPLPRNWVESVAKAILAGGINSTASDTASTKTLSTRKTTSALSDNTNVLRRPGTAVTKARPPRLCAQVQTHRARTIESKVSHTRVVCRSAPASRAASRTRPTDTDSGRGRQTDDERRKEKLMAARNAKAKGKRRESDGVPSLARTKAENEDWSPRSRYLGGWGMGGDQSNDRRGGFSPDESDEDDDEDEEEGELSLDRLLVPARRQHSIRSLRKHLQRLPSAAGIIHGVSPASPRASGRLSPWAVSSGGESDGQRHRAANGRDDSWGTGRGRRWTAGEEDDEGDGYGNGVSSGFSGSGARNGSKRRRGLPGSWAHWAGVGGAQ